MNQSDIAEAEKRQARALGNIYKDELGLKRGLKILQFIESHPGTHLRGIMRSLDLPMGALQYHLYRLEEGRVIISRRRYMHKRYYRTLHFSEKELAVLDVLSQESEGDILLFLTSSQNQNMADIARHFRLANSTVLWHLKRLVASGLVVAIRQGSKVVYSVEVDKEEVFRLARSYHPTLWERLSDRLADAVLGGSGTAGEGETEDQLVDSSPSDGGDNQ